MGHSPPPFPVVRHKRVYSRVSTNKGGLTIDTNSTRQNEDLKAIQQHLTKVLGSVRERHNLTQLEVRKGPRQDKNYPFTINNNTRGVKRGSSNNLEGGLQATNIGSPTPASKIRGIFDSKAVELSLQKYYLDTHDYQRFTLETKDIPSSGTMSGVIGPKTPTPL